MKGLQTHAFRYTFFRTEQTILKISVDQKVIWQNIVYQKEREVEHIEFMSWTTVYVKGNIGFEAEVNRHLEKSGFSFLPGSGSENEFSLFWINDRAQLREFNPDYALEN